MDRAQKEASVAERHAVFNEVESVVVTQNAGLTVTQMTELRNQMRAEGVSFKVAKNRLVIRALKGTRFEGISDLLKGPVGLATSKDPVAAAKIAYNFSKSNENLIILGGALGKDILDFSGIEALAKLPSLDEVRAKFVGLLQTPAQRIAVLCQAPASQLARVTRAHADKG